LPGKCQTQLKLVLPARRADKDVPKGSIVLDEVQAYNLHVVPGDTQTFKAYRPQPGQEGHEELVEVELECRIFQGSTNTPGSSTSSPASLQEADAEQRQGQQVCVDAAALTQQLKRSLFGRYLARGEWVVMSVPVATPLAAEPANGNGASHSNGVAAPQTVMVAMRVTSTDTLPVAEREDVIGYHCYRGQLGPSTAVYLQSEKQSGGQVEAGLGIAQLSLQNGNKSVGARPTLVLMNAAQREVRPPPTDVVHVTTSDGEWFPVKKKLLRPCIALTKVGAGVRLGHLDVSGQQKSQVVAASAPTFKSGGREGVVLVKAACLDTVLMSILAHQMCQRSTQPHVTQAPS
jgi:hypothetical protein